MDPLATAKALYAAFNAHNIPGILALLENKVVWEAFGPDFALAIGTFTGKSGVTDFFGKLVGPTGQQVDTIFMPQNFYVGGGTVHVTGFEAGKLTRFVANGSDAGKQFFNHFDHTIWFGPSGKISRFRANYQLALSGPNWVQWPPMKGKKAKAGTKPTGGSKSKAAPKSKTAKPSKVAKTAKRAASTKRR